MTPTERLNLQSAVLNGIRSAARDGRPSNTRIADVLGCDRSEISRFEAGTRRIDLDELVAAAEEWGPVAVLGPIADRFGCQVVPNPEAVPLITSRAPAAAELGTQVAHLTLAVLEAERDGALDARERKVLADSLDAIARRVAALRSGLGRVA